MLSGGSTTKRVKQSDITSMVYTLLQSRKQGTENTTVIVQMEEEKRAIRSMPFVTTLSPVRTVKDKVEG